MKTTLNFPDNLVSSAKIKAAVEHTTLTALIVEGLELRLRQGGLPGELPVSKALGGLRAGFTWEHISRNGKENRYYR